MYDIHISHFSFNKDEATIYNPPEETIHTPKLFLYFNHVQF